LNWLLFVFVSFLGISNGWAGEPFSRLTDREPSVFREPFCFDVFAPT
jgi:hypothetical protein